MGCPRVSYRRRTHYATRSNRVKFVRTPGNRLVLQKRKKRTQGPHSPWVLGHKRLPGTKALRPIDARRASTHTKSVSRPYGGVLPHDQVRDRIIRAFLMEEQRILRKNAQAKVKYQRQQKRQVKKQKKRRDVRKADAREARRIAAEQAAKTKKQTKKGSGKRDQKRKAQSKPKPTKAKQAGGEASTKAKGRSAADPSKKAKRNVTGKAAADDQKPDKAPKSTSPATVKHVDPMKTSHAAPSSSKDGSAKKKRR